MKDSFKRILKASAYSAATLLVIIATLVLVAIGRGYFFDIKTGEVAGGGLILLGSRPDSAEVILDGEKINKATPSRISLRAGDYSVRLEKAGFRPWQKQVPVVTSEVSWAQYPFLIPETMVTNSVADTAQPLIFSQSPDRKFGLIGLNTSPQQIGLLELGKTEIKTIYTLSPAQVNASLTLGDAAWADDNEHVLITLHGPAKPQYLVVNVLNPTEQFNMTSDFGLDLPAVRFSAQNWQELYYISPEGLRKLDLGSKTISAVLASNVVRFEPAREAVFLTQVSSEGMHLVRLERNGQTKTLSTLLPVADYLLAYSQFEQTSTVVLADKTNQKISFYTTGDEQQQTPNILEHAPVETIMVSPNQKFLVSHKAERFISYDFEFSRSYHFSLKSANYGPLSWFDNYHLLSNIDSTMTLLEFDGANQEPLLNSLPGLPAFSNKDQKLLYSFGRSEANGSSQLHVSQLRP